jgi:hypothetical protein
MGPLEDIQKFFDGGIVGFATATNDVLKSAFSSTDISSNWWISVIGGTIRTHTGGTVTEVTHPGMLPLLVQVMAPVLVILVAVQVAVSLFRQSTVGLIRAGAAAVFSIPATYVLAGIMFTLIQILDKVSMWILAAGTNDGEDAVVGEVLALFGLTWDPATKAVVLDENYQAWAMAKDQDNPGAILVPMILIFVVWIVAMLLAAFMVYRLLALTILASLLPVAVMSQPLEAAKGMAKGFGLTILALLLAKPISALVLKLGMIISSTANSTFQFLAGLMCLFVAAIMPTLTTKFISFLTGGAGDGIIGGGGQIGSGAGRRIERHGGGALRSSQRTISNGTRRLARAGR